MTDLITDEAVEKAAQALHDNRAMRSHALHEVGEPLGNTVYDNERRADARAALEAAAPLIAAKAWDEGYAEGGRGRMWDSINPYCAERIERAES